MTRNVDAETAKAMAYPWRGDRRQGPRPSLQLLTPDAADRWWRDEPFSDDVIERGAWEDAAADRLYDEPGDPLLDDEGPYAGNPWWKDGI